MSASHTSHHSGSHYSQSKVAGANATGGSSAMAGSTAPFAKALNAPVNPDVLAGVMGSTGSASHTMPRLESSNFFKMSGMPRFGKQWLDNFIADQELQNTFLTSEVVRNLVMLECVFFASVFNDLILYKQAFLL